MGKKTGGGGQPVEESAEGAVQLIEGLKPEMSQTFINWKGEPMDW